MDLSDMGTDSAPAQMLGCTSCAGGELRRDRVGTALWRGDRLMVIEEIPALVCTRCGERYFEDETAMALDMMRAGKGAAGRPARILSVPVYPYAPPGAARSDGETL